MMYWGMISLALFALAFMLLCVLPAIKRPVLAVIKTCGGLCLLMWGPLIFCLSLEYAHVLVRDDPFMPIMMHLCAAGSALSLIMGGTVTIFKQTSEFVDDFKWAFNYRKKRT